MTNKRLLSRNIIMAIIGISLAIHISTLWLNATIYQGLQWVNLPIHSALEISGTCIAFFVAYFLLKLSEGRHEQKITYSILSSALITMGFFDGLHAVYDSGKLFVWFHSCATFLGGFTFCLLYLKNTRFIQVIFSYLPGVSITVSILLCSLSVIFSHKIPDMLINGNFTPFATFLNIAGGVFFILSALKLFQIYHQSQDIDSLLFFLHTFLFGSAAIMFEQSHLWDTAWWGWHFLRFAAYGVALYYIIKSFNFEIGKEKDLLRMQLYQKSKLASIGELASGIGHEINNPLTIIQGNLEIIQSQRNLVPEKARKNLHKISIALERISTIVQSLKVLSWRNEIDETGKFNLGECLAQNFNLFSDIYEKDNIKLTIDISQLPIDTKVAGNLGKFNQVIVNLISNAKDSSIGKEHPSIHLRCYTKENQTAIIEITDNGHGIPKTIQDRIYDPFFTTKDIGKGSGIGLSIVYNFLTQELNGNISFQTNENTGTTFYVSIPILERK